MPAQRTSAPPRTSPQRIAAARARQLEQLYRAIDTPHVVGADSHPTRCEAVRDELLSCSTLASLGHHATVAALTDFDGIRETLTVLHTLKDAQRVAAVVYAVEVEGCVTYECQVRPDRDPWWSLWRLAVDVTTRAL